MKPIDLTPPRRRSRLAAFCAAFCVFGAFMTATAPADATARVTSLYPFNKTTGWSPTAFFQGTDGNFYGTTEFGGANFATSITGQGTGVVYKMTPNGKITTLYTFSDINDVSQNQDGALPISLIQAGDGNFYGVTYRGGTNGSGTIYKLTPSGALTTLHTFSALSSSPNGVNQDGSYPISMIQGADGNFYGATGAGGAGGTGTVFRVTPGGVFTVLHTFNAANGSNANSSGANPENLLQGADGNFYGTCFYGGPAGLGTVFRMSPVGGFTTLVSFNGANGWNPTALSQASDGSFYGTTLNILSSDATAFTLSASGTLTTLAQFTGANGQGAVSLTQDRDGYFYGASIYGGDFGYGTLFRMSPSGIVTTAYSFPSVDSNYANTGGAKPQGLILGHDGNVYGTTQVGGGVGAGTVFEVEVASQELFSFSAAPQGSNVSGALPVAGLTQGYDGNLYGTAISGGPAKSGTEYRISESGVFSPLYDFSALDANGINGDGAYSYAALCLGTDGNFYGTTSSGGPNGTGTVFKVTPTGALTTLYDFSDDSRNLNPDGANPFAGLVQGNDGNFYGTAQVGGASGTGTVFRVTPSGGLTTLHSFSAFSGDGAYPSAALVLGNDGNLYGTTRSGGLGNEGTVFVITTGGNVTILHQFSSVTNGSNSDGALPNGLVQGNDGNFYGTCHDGGSGYGTVFQITPAGAFTVLHKFAITPGTYSYLDGANPEAGLAEGSDGSFYGTTTRGGLTGLGIVGNGTAFRITPSGTLTTLMRFDGLDGADPEAALTPAYDGNFYGTTTVGGAGNTGVVYRLAGPPVAYGSEANTVEDTPMTFTVPFYDPNGYGIEQIDFPNPPANGSLIVGPISETGTQGSISFTYYPYWGTFGSDSFTYTVTGTTGTSTPATVFLYVTPVPAFVTVVPSSPTVPVAGTRSFTALVTDEGGTPFTPSSLTWSVSGGGTIDASGNFTAGTTPGTSTVTATATSGGVSQAGTASVTVTASPTITVFTPTSGPVGTSVAITGANFTGATSVTFNGTTAKFTVNSATKITATVPAGATSGSITITTPIGAGGGGPFLVTASPKPTITSISPISGPIGTVVTVTGTHFTGTTVVRFHNANAATFSVNGAGTQITVPVPTGAGTGTITVTAPGGMVKSAQTFTVTVPPTITSISPTSGPVGTHVTVTGTGFTGTTTVRFHNANAVTFSVNGAGTQITVTVPSGAGTGTITVTTPGGSVKSAQTFTVS